jgi:hypothetical protein
MVCLASKYITCTPEDLNCGGGGDSSELWGRRCAGALACFLNLSENFDLMEEALYSRRNKYCSARNYCSGRMTSLSLDGYRHALRYSCSFIAFPVLKVSTFLLLLLLLLLLLNCMFYTLRHPRYTQHSFWLWLFTTLLPLFM